MTCCWMRLSSLVVFLGCLICNVHCSSSSSSSSSPRQTMNFALTLRVDGEEFNTVVADLESLLQHAKDSKMGANTVMFLRGALDKVQTSLSKMEAEKKKEEEKLESIQNGPAVFTNETIAVKPLKAAASKDKKKKGGVTTYKVKEFQDLLSKKKINFKQPFLISGGVNQFEKLQQMLTASKLITNENVEVRYLSPVLAKKKRTFDEPTTQQPEEQMEYNIISLEKYFRNCFNYKAKPDFKKVPGSDTEHCEQSIAASLIDDQFLGNFTYSAISELNSLQLLEKGRKWFRDHEADIAPMLPDGTSVKSHFSQSEFAFVVMGPAGSGEQLRQEKKHFVDGLVHGKRKWFFMSPENFVKLREVAKDVLEPASAFMFFEQQMGELKEEHGLGSAGLPFMECIQNPTDLLFVPGDLIQTSLSLEDTISLRQHVVESKQAALERVGRSLWAPETGVVPNGYLAAVCYNFELGSVPISPQLNAMQASIVQQIMQQYYASPKAQNGLILNILHDCSGLLKSEEMASSAAVCKMLWPQCTTRLKQNLEQNGQSLPSWMSTVPSYKKKSEL